MIEQDRCEHSEEVLQITKRKRSDSRKRKKMPSEIGFLTGQKEKIKKRGGERGERQRHLTGGDSWVSILTRGVTWESE